MNTLFINKDLIKEIGMLNEDLFTREDGEFVLRIIKKGYFTFLNKYYSIWNEGEDNINAFNSKVKINYSFQSKKFKSELIYFKIIKNIIEKYPENKFKKMVFKKIKKQKGYIFWYRGYIYRKKNKKKALYYFSRSIIYHYKFNRLKSIGKLFIPGYYKNLNNQI